MPNGTITFEGATKVEGLLIFMGYPLILVLSHLWTLGYRKFLKGKVSDGFIEHLEQDLEPRGLQRWSVISGAFIPVPV